MNQERTKSKHKGLASFLLPNKPPNKVGVAINRSQSAKEPNLRNLTHSEANSPIKISKRPLSFDVKNGSLKKKNALLEPPLTALKRENSLSESHLFVGDQIDSLAEKPLEKYGSHESVLKEAISSLHKIPTAKARERNFLHGKIGANSLLGSPELDRLCPNREITIFVGTWNMNGHSPPKELNDFVLPIGMKHVPDVLSFGTQESCSERFEWEVSLQETIGPSHILFHSISLGTLHLCIFIRRDLIWYVSIPEDASLSVRAGTAFRTKGAVAGSFMIFGTSFLFVTAHLTAHQEKIKERVGDVKKIVHSLDLPRALPCKNKSKDLRDGRKLWKSNMDNLLLCVIYLLLIINLLKLTSNSQRIALKRHAIIKHLGHSKKFIMIAADDVTQNFDYVFWSGDLNFRLATPRNKVLEWLSNTSFPLPPHLPHGYMHHDQLCTVLADGAAFRGFCEAKITFPPTYKYDPGTQNFDTSSKQRTPAYTDRILYKQKNSRRLSGLLEHPPLQCLVYDSVQSITTSDHKPVWGVFRVHLRPGLDTIPLAAGMFNRDVYLEGLKRRAETLSKSKGASAVCSLQ